MRWSRLAFPWLVALVLSGCITDQGTVMIATPRPVPLDLRGRDVTALPVKRDVVGRDVRVTSILFIPTFDPPRLERAIEDALRKGGGDLMTRARVSSTDFWFLVGISTLTVRGDVVDLGKGFAAQEVEP
jgi:hypothetical protein